MNVLFFSDLHGSIGGLEKLFVAAERIKPDLWVLLGDVLYHGPRNELPPDYAPRRVAEMLRVISRDLIAVRGNCDSEVDQMMLDFPMRADYAVLATETGRFFLTHGHLWDGTHLPPLAGTGVFAQGHTHIAALNPLESGVVLFNPGSVALPKNGAPPSFGTLEDGVLHVRRLDDGSDLLAPLPMKKG